MIKIARAKRILAARVNSLYKEMNIIVSLIIQIYRCPKDLYSIAKKDFLILDGDKKTTQKEISYSINIYEGKTKKTGLKNFGTLDSIIKDCLRKILNEIDYIKKYEYLYATCTEFMEEIRNIEGCGFIRCYRKDKEFPSQCFLYGDTSDMLTEFLNSFLRLDKMKFHTEYSIVILDSEDETKAYHDNRESGKYIEDVKKAGDEENKKMIEKRTLVLVDNDYFGQIIWEQLKRNVRADYLNIDAVSINMFKYYRNVIAIVNTKTFKKIQKLLHEVETPIKVFLIMNNHPLKKNYKRISNNAEVEVVEIFFYKKPRKIWKTDFYINKEEPSEKTIYKFVKDIKSIILGTE